MTCKGDIFCAKPPEGLMQRRAPIEVRLDPRNGFEWCGAFGDYEASEHNVFMRRAVS